MPIGIVILGQAIMNAERFKYVGDVVRELAELADGEGGDTLAYILRMAAAEAEGLFNAQSQSRRLRSRESMEAPRHVPGDFSPA